MASSIFAPQFNPEISVGESTPPQIEHLPDMWADALRFRLGQIASRQYPYEIHILSPPNNLANNTSNPYPAIEYPDMTTVCVPLTEKTKPLIQSATSNGRVIVPVKRVQEPNEIIVPQDKNRDPSTTLFFIDGADENFDGRLLSKLNAIKNPVAINIAPDTSEKRIQCIFSRLMASGQGKAIIEDEIFNDRLILSIDSRSLKHGDVEMLQKKLKIIKEIAGRCVTLVGCPQRHHKPDKRDVSQLEAKIKWVNTAAIGTTVKERIDGVSTLLPSNDQLSFIRNPDWDSDAIKSFYSNVTR